MIRFYNVWAEIDLDILAHNLHCIKTRLEPRSKVLAVVKADAYGHGLCAVAQRLSAEGVDFFGVATIAEGCKLKNCGITEPILLLRNILVCEMPDLLDAGIIPSISSLEHAQAAESYGRAKNKKITVHLRIDTGCDDDGITRSCCEKYFNELSQCQFLDIQGIYTHFAYAYGYNEVKFQSQLDDFQAVLKLAEKSGLKLPLIHAASSPAIFRYPESHFDMVRVGTALYGVPFIHDELVDDIKPVMSLKSRVVSIKDFAESCLTGYGREPVNQKGVRIAYVAAGYADIPFLLVQKGLRVLVNGQFVAVYGSAYMDTIKLDVSALGHDIKPGDEVVFIGQQMGNRMDVAEVASCCGINKVNCEIVCFLGERVERIYTGTRSLD
jgi:alanine racemase